MAFSFLHYNKFSSFVILVLVVIALSPQEVNGDKKVAKKETLPIPEDRRHYCCARYSRIIVVGHGITGEEIKVDAGYCKSFCPKHFADDAGDLVRPAVQKCTANMYCRALTTRLERVSTVEGIKTVEIVESCDCTYAHLCRREALHQTLYFGTPFHVEIDTGICVGTCRPSSAKSSHAPELKNRSCRALRNSSMSIKGPNGDETRQIIERCGCAGSCHRMDRIETILDFSRIELGENMNIADAVPRLMHINVGQCVGTCGDDSSKVSSKICSNVQLWTGAIKSKSTLKKCLPTLFSDGRLKCTPAKFRVHEYRTRRGHKREIIQISKCACL